MAALNPKVPMTEFIFLKKKKNNFISCKNQKQISFCKKKNFFNIRCDGRGMFSRETLGLQAVALVANSYLSNSSNFVTSTSAEIG